MKKLFLLSIINFAFLTSTGASLLDYSQNSYQRRNSVIFIETHVLPNDTLLDCYITYKIAYNNLVFVKSDSVYKGGISFFLEVVKDEQVVGRESGRREIDLSDYESTNSANRYLQGMLKFSLEKGNYIFIPSVSILNTGDNIFLEQNSLILEKEFDINLIKPIVIENEDFAIGDMIYNPIANFQNYIPYSADNYSLVFPVIDLDIDSLKVSVKQTGQVKDFVLLRNAHPKSLSFEFSNNSVYLEMGTGEQKMNIFVLENINQILHEGLAEITLFLRGDEKKTFNYNVVWVDKPRSLRNIEYAIKLLKNVTSEEIVDRLLDYPEEDQYKELTKFWENKDPRNNTSFNELMNEFYTRADYVNDNFSTIDNNGTSLDRGKIYLKFGPPSNIERIFNDKGNVVEIWYYGKLNREFYFNDKSGLGNFSLMN